MVEVAPLLWVGDAGDYAEVRPMLNWAVLTAARDPWHRAALGYTTQGAPKDNREYLYALRGSQLILNLVDAPDKKYFSDELIGAGLAFVSENVGAGLRTLIHCNRGESRAPSLALLWMHAHGWIDPDLDAEAAKAVFTGLYPAYAPGAGMWGYCLDLWARPGGTQNVKVSHASEQEGHASRAEAAEGH